MRYEYWSNSKLANRIRGTAKPPYATAEEWDEWDTAARTVHPWRYWIAEDFLDMAQDVVYFIPDKIKDIRSYLQNRFITKTHALTSTLPRGAYHEFDTRVLYCLFDELVSFVEVEKANMERICNKEKYKDSKYPDRDEDAGIAYLQWESNLVNDIADPSDPNYLKPTPQATNAKWVLDAYYWWKVVRPLRGDPYEVCGFNDAYDDTVEGWLCGNKIDKSIFDAITKMEAEYYEEDTQKLIELIQHRNGLWT